MNRLPVAGFTNLGYLLHSTRFEPLEADLSGQTALVTGGTGGLGRATVQGLARLGARVVAVGRDPDKLTELRNQAPGAVVTQQADLASLAEIRRLAERVLETEPRLDILVNNVGVLLPRREETAEGLERTLATNLAGHFLLTNLLIPRLMASSPARIINVSSGGTYLERIRPRDLQFRRGRYRGSVAYARTKRGQVILTEMWAERLQDRGVVVHAMHPGWAATAGLASSLPGFTRLTRPLLRTPQQGADTIIWLAAASQPAESTGRFWLDRRVAPTHLLPSTRESPRDRQDLWEQLTVITGADVPAHHMRMEGW